jgi:hypothetical protein
MKVDRFVQPIAAAVAIFGTIDTVILAALIIYGVYLWFRGILPAMIRLGNGLASRQIAVFAKNDNLGSLVNLLKDSGLFREKNICPIAKTEDLGRAERAGVYLVFWPDWSDAIQEILDIKPDSCPLVVYAPIDQGRIPDAAMRNLDGKRNTAVTNFRGRLLNDIVTAMITTSYVPR